MQVQAVNSFGIKYLHNLITKAHTNNGDDIKLPYIISPIGLSLGALMIAEALQGEAKEEVLKSFGLQEFTSSSARSLVDDLKDAKYSTVDVANALWYNKKFAIKDSYLDLCEESLHSSAKKLTGDAVDDINKWVAKATHNKVEKIVEESPEPSQAAVINCVTFKSEWKHRFNPSQTTTSSFTPFNGASKDVAMMKLDREVLLLETDKFKAIQLPYDDRFVATAVLPLERGVVALNRIVKRLGEATVSWKDFSAQFKEKETTLYFPRVKVEYHDNHVEDYFTQLGVKMDLTGVVEKGDSSGSAAIKQIIHRTTVSIGEKGTEPLSGKPGSPIEDTKENDLRFDRSFLLMINDSETGCLVAVGVVDEFQPVSAEDSSDKPRKRSVSPRKRSVSPRKRSTSPRRNRSRTPSPRRDRDRKRYHSRSRSRSPRYRGGGYRDRGYGGGRYNNRGYRSPPRYRGGYRSRSRSPPRAEERKCLFVRNFGNEVKKLELEDLFGKCGDIKNLYVGINKEGNPYAFISYFDYRDAKDAMDKYRDHELGGNKLVLDWDVGLENKRRRPNNNGRDR